MGALGGSFCTDGLEVPLSLGRRAGAGRCSEVFALGTGVSCQQVVKMFYVDSYIDFYNAQYFCDNEFLILNKLSLLLGSHEGVDGQTFPTAKAKGLARVGLGPERPAFVMSMLHGESLRDFRLRVAGVCGGVVPAHVVLAFVRALLGPLSLLERAEVSHGDLNAGNVLLNFGADPRIPVAAAVIDFGAARLHGETMLVRRLDRERRVRAARAGTEWLSIFASSSLIPPELYGDACRDDCRLSSATPKSNIWFLGALALWLRTGRLPGNDDAPAFGVLADAHAEWLRSRILASGDDSVGELDILAGILAGCFRRNPDERPSTGEIHAMLDGRGSRSLAVPAAQLARSSFDGRGAAPASVPGHECQAAELLETTRKPAPVVRTEPELPRPYGRHFARDVGQDAVPACSVHIRRVGVMGSAIGEANAWAKYETASGMPVYSYDLGQWAPKECAARVMRHVEASVECALASGYPYVRLYDGGDMDRFITQAAIWALTTGNGILRALTAEADPYGIFPIIEELVAYARAACDGEAFSSEFVMLSAEDGESGVERFVAHADICTCDAGV